MPHPSDSSDAVLRAVDRLVDGVNEFRDLRAHGLHLIGARRARERGAPVPADVAEAERRAAVQALTVPLALRRVRELGDGPIAVLKGPELAARYGDATLRPSTDVDLLALDADDLQRRLLADGFTPFGDPADYGRTHHLQPLFEPKLGVKIEIHRRPEWVDWATPPATAELLALAVPSAVGVDGISALPPAQHALVVAAHSWSQLPFRRLLDLVDLQLLLVDVAPGELAPLAADWGLARVVRALAAAGDCILFGASPTWALRTWASDVRHAREQTVLRTHLHRLAGPFWAQRPAGAVQSAARGVARVARRHPGETWGRKVRRSLVAVRNARRRRSEHDSHLESR